MNRTVFGKIIGYAFVAVFLQIGCNGKNPVDNDDPEFSNVTKFEEGKIYVAYPFVDKWKNKLDTITLSFDYNGSKVKSISVTATLDSGKKWLPVATVTPSSSNSETIHWVPKTSSAVPKYFGVKHCFIRITDTTTDKFIDSDTFPLLGSIPFILLDSLSNKTFKVTDTIKVQYGMNMDLNSNVSTLFKTDSMKNWVEFTNSSNLPSPDEPTILNKQKGVILDTLKADVKTDAGNFTKPIKILLQDYGASSYNIVTGYITIQP